MEKNMVVINPENLDTNHRGLVGMFGRIVEGDKWNDEASTLVEFESLPDYIMGHKGISELVNNSNCLYIPNASIKKIEENEEDVTMELKGGDRVRIVGQGNVGVYVDMVGTVIDSVGNDEAFVLVSFDGFTAGHAGDNDELGKDNRTGWFTFRDTLEVVEDAPSKKCEDTAKKMVEAREEEFKTKSTVKEVIDEPTPEYAQKCLLQLVKMADSDVFMVGMGRGEVVIHLDPVFGGENIHLTEQEKDTLGQIADRLVTALRERKEGGK